MSAVQKRISPVEAAGEADPAGGKTLWAFEVVDRPKGRAMDEAVFKHIREGLEIVSGLPENKALKFELRSDDAYSTVRRHLLQVAHLMGMKVMVGHRGRTVFISRLRDVGEAGVDVVDLSEKGRTRPRRAQTSGSNNRGRNHER
jgi:hypothetical protein